MVLSYGKIIEEEPETDIFADNLSDNSDNNATNEGEDAIRIIKLSVKTLYWVMIGLALFAVMFVMVFPYNALKIYTDLNLKVRALESAELYVSANKSKFSSTNQPSYNSKFADALYAQVYLSVELMNNAISKTGYKSNKTLKYAKKVDKHVDEYLSYPSMSSRTALIDSYSINNSLVSFRVYAYSFETDIKKAQVTAKYLLGKQNESWEYFFNATNDFAFSDMVIDEEALRRYSPLFNQIAAAVEIELRTLGYYKHPITIDGVPADVNAIITAGVIPTAQNFKYLFDKDAGKLTGAKDEDEGKSATLIKLEDRLSDFKNFAINFSPNNASQMLDKLYYVKSMSDLIMSVRNALQLLYMCRAGLYTGAKHENIEIAFDRWDDVYMNVNDGGIDKTIHRWFMAVLMPEYAQMVLS